MALMPGAVTGYEAQFDFPLREQPPRLTSTVVHRVEIDLTRE